MGRPNTRTRSRVRSARTSPTSPSGCARRQRHSARTRRHPKARAARSTRRVSSCAGSSHSATRSRSATASGVRVSRDRAPGQSQRVRGTAGGQAQRQQTASTAARPERPAGSERVSSARTVNRARRTAGPERSAERAGTRQLRQQRGGRAGRCRREPPRLTAASPPTAIRVSSRARSGCVRANAEALRSSVRGSGVDTADLDRAIENLRRLERSGALTIRARRSGWRAT